MKEKQINWTIGDGLRGTATLEAMFDGRNVWTQADAFRAMVDMCARAERVFFMAAPGGAIPADAMLLTIGGRSKAELDTVPDEVELAYYATQRALASLFYTARRVHPTTPTIDIPVDVPAALPIVVALTVLGVTAVAATAWFAAESGEQKVELERHRITVLSQVDLYLKDLQARIAAGQPLPDPPSSIVAAGEVQKNTGSIMLGAGLLLGGAAVAGVVVGLKRAERAPVVSNPRRRAAARARVGRARVSSGASWGELGGSSGQGASLRRSRRRVAATRLREATRATPSARTLRALAPKAFPSRKRWPPRSLARARAFAASTQRRPCRLTSGTQKPRPAEEPAEPEPPSRTPRGVARLPRSVEPFAPLGR